MNKNANEKRRGKTHALNNAQEMKCMALDCTSLSFLSLTFGKQTHFNMFQTGVGGLLCSGQRSLRLSCCSNSSTPLKSFLPSHQQQDAHKYSRYCFSYAAAFILRIGVFVLNWAFVRGAASLEADGWIRSQRVELEQT